MDRIHDILNGISEHQKISKSDTLFDDRLIMEPDPQTTNDSGNVSDESDDDSMLELEDYKEQFLSMSQSSINNILLHAHDILEHLSDPSVKENLTEPWLQGMIAITENNMTTIHDFVMSRLSTDDNSSDGSASKKPGLWENIRRKKEREGKNYKPAKPGDKDRPDSETWKKLTKEKPKK